MLTVRDIIRQALLLIGAVRAGENLDAQEADDARVTLNMMLNSWFNEGIDLEYLSKENLDDVMDYPEDHLVAFIYNLAVLLAPSYEKRPSPEVMGVAASTFRSLQVAYMEPDTLAVDPALMSYNLSSSNG